MYILTSTEELPYVYINRKGHMAQQVFRRTEVKYRLSEQKYQELLCLIEPYLKKDQYFKGTNCSVYYDTDSRYLAIHSLEKPLYKEKVRLRSYEVPKLDDTVFIEIKKKYKGVGSKRRVPIKLADFYDFETTGRLDTGNPIIDAEIKECFNRYHLKPTMYLAYDRSSYCDRSDPRFRVTFDQNIRSRNTDLCLEHGDRGTKFFKNGEIIMEVKALNAYPLWFVRALSKLKIYPSSFSKYGRVTEKVISKKEKSYV